MKHLTNYTLFCEANEEEIVSNNILSDIDTEEIENFNNKIDGIKLKIEKKREDLENKLNILSNLQTDGFTEDDGVKIEDKKKEIRNQIDKIKNDIKTFEDTIKDFKLGMGKLKENK